MKRPVKDDPDAVVLKPIPHAFVLQCDDLEKELHPKNTTISTWELYSQKVCGLLEGSKLKHSCDFKNVDYWKSQNVEYPLAKLSSVIGNTSSTLPVYKWIAPEQVKIAGDTVTKLSTNSNYTVQAYVRIPDEIFGKRDFVNVVYPAKRAHYMASAVVAIRKGLPSLDVSFIPGANSDFLFPNILIKDTSSPNGSIEMFFYSSETTTAKPSRFAPNVGNIRPNTVNPKYTGEDNVPTPRYNQRLLRNMLQLELEQRIAKELQQKPTVLRALLLIRAWFKAREIQQFDSLFISMYMVHLLKSGIVLATHDAVTIVRSYFSAMIKWDATDAIGLHPEDLPADVLTMQKSTWPVVLLDYSGYWNLANNITIESLNRVKAEMTVCLPLLGDINAFDALFIDSQHFNTSFDHYIRLAITSVQLESISSRFVVDVVDSNDRLNAFILHFQQVLKTAMGERFEYLDSRIICGPGSLSSSVESPNDYAILFGFKSSKQWSNPITVGPWADDDSSKEFRAFWKGASQLRKFADTRICESMVWSESPSNAVPLSIIKFILERHLSLPATCASWRSVFPSSICADRQTTDKINTAYADLSSILRSLKGVPLMVTNIFGISPYLRGAEPDSIDVFSTNFGTLESKSDHRVPSMHKIPKYTPSVLVHLRMEYSGKWGYDVEGIRRLTAAFYIQMADSLKTNHSLVAVPTMDQLFVMKDDIVFKLVIVTEKAHKILEFDVNKLKDSGATRIESTTEAKRLNAFQKKFVSEPLLQGSLQSFSLKHEVFADSVQLLKRWLGAQLLSGAIHDLALEMIVAAAIEQPAIAPPLTAWAAFRRCLLLLSTHNWVARPLFLDFFSEWKDEDRLEIESNFVKMRPVLPPMVIITNEDKVGSKWTRDGPSPLILKRVVGLAKSTLNLLNSNMISTLPLDMTASLLSTNTDQYDAIVTLSDLAVNRRPMDLVPGNTKQLPVKVLPVLDFDPVEELVYSLNANFHSVALFFYNKYAGDSIGIKWKPQEEIVPSKISRCSLHKSVQDGRLALNRQEVIEGINILGKTLIRSVQQK